jgi:hypothetical protein
VSRQVLCFNRAQGNYLQRYPSKACYAVIRHNIRTYISAGVVQVIGSRKKAVEAIAQLELAQTSHDRDDGWRYFLEETDLTPGMDAVQATSRRWLELEIRESNLNRPSHNVAAEQSERRMKFMNDAANSPTRPQKALRSREALNDVTSRAEDAAQMLKHARRQRSKRV